MLDLLEIILFVLFMGALGAGSFYWTQIAMEIMEKDKDPPSGPPLV